MADDRTPIGVSIDEIDEGLRPAREMRMALNEAAVGRYQEHQADLPPPRLMRDRETGRYWVVDGAHTITAAIRLEDNHIRVILVGEGTYWDALRAASRCNRQHGVPIEDGDKRHLVEAVLAKPEAARMTQKQIADYCNVDQSYVSRVKAKHYDSHNASPPDPRGLTAAEKKVAEVCAAEPRLPVKAAAERAGVSERTVNKARGKLATPPAAKAGRDAGRAGNGKVPAPRAARPAAPAEAEDGVVDGGADVPHFGCLALSDEGRRVLAAAGFSQEVKFRVSIRRGLDRETDYGPGPYVTLEVGWGADEHGEFIPLAVLDLIEPVAWDLSERLGIAVGQAGQIAARDRGARRR
jgi:hypothetical protein